MGGISERLNQSSVKRLPYWRDKLKFLNEKRQSSPAYRADYLERLGQSLKYWERQYSQAVTFAGERKRVFKTTSGFEVKPLYTPLDIKWLDYEADLGFSGLYPFTRGVYTTMYRSRIWTMRQFSGFGTPEDTNRRLRFLLEHGETGLSIAFDMPTLYGYDPDNPRCEGEVG
ncbi:MAG: methylmalonyl-CoA mutase family protein, partial [Nitrososphaerota archaeon]